MAKSSPRSYTIGNASLSLAEQQKEMDKLLKRDPTATVKDFIQELEDILMSSPENGDISDRSFEKIKQYRFVNALVETSSQKKALLTLIELTKDQLPFSAADDCFQYSLKEIAQKAKLNNNEKFPSILTSLNGTTGILSHADTDKTHFYFTFGHELRTKLLELHSGV